MPRLCRSLSKAERALSRISCSALRRGRSYFGEYPSHPIELQQQAPVFPPICAQATPCPKLSFRILLISLGSLLISSGVQVLTSHQANRVLVHIRIRSLLLLNRTFPQRNDPTFLDNSKLPVKFPFVKSSVLAIHQSFVRPAYFQRLMGRGKKTGQRVLIACSHNHSTWQGWIKATVQSSKPRAHTGMDNGSSFVVTGMHEIIALFVGTLG